MTFQDFSNEEKIFAVAVFKKVVEDVSKVPLLTMTWAFTGVPDYFRKFMSKYGDIVQETMVAPDVAEAHGISAYVYRNMTKEKIKFLGNKFGEALKYADEPALNLYAVNSWNSIINSLK